MPSFAREELVDLRSYGDECEEELIELAPGETSLSLLQRIYRSVRQPLARRMRAAEQALQFEHPKLGAMASTSLSANDFAAMLDRAIARSGKAPEIKQIESRAEPTGNSEHR